MKILDLQQNTPEWESFRRTHVGASDIGIIMTGTDQEVYQLYRQKKFGEKKYTTPAMQRGHDLEPDAVSYFELLTGKKFEKITGLSQKHEWLMASFDGYDAEDQTVLEVKALSYIPDSVEAHRDYKKFWWQVQAQLMVSEAYGAYLLYYSPEKQVSGLITPDLGAFEQIALKGKWMDDCLKEVIDFPIPMIDRYDSDWFEAADAWRKAKEALGEAQELEAICREAMIYLSGEISCVGNGVSVMRSERKGPVEYSKIPELKTVDLDAFRKPKSIIWTVTLRIQGENV